MAKLSDLPKIVEQALNSRKILDAVGRSVSTDLVKRTKVGKGVKENFDPPHKLPELKDNTVKTRRSLRKSGRLTGKGATPKKSNVTRSGEMLDSVTYGVGRGQVEIKLQGREQEKKATRLLAVSPDYQFMRVSKQEFNRAVKLASKFIGQILSKINITDL